MARVTTDANGYEIDLRVRGLRLCQTCGLVYSEGYMVEGGDGYACSDECLVAGKWTEEPDEHSKALGLPVLTNEAGWEYVHITPALIGRWLEAEENHTGPRCDYYCTDWEG